MDGSLPASITGRTYEAVLVDWYGTAVTRRQADGAEVRARIEELCRSGVHVVVVSDASVVDVDTQLSARPRGPGSLHLCLDRGSAVHAVSTGGPAPVWRRPQTGGGDPSDAIRWATTWLAAQGITGGLILVAGIHSGPAVTPQRGAWMFVPELARSVVVSVGPEPPGGSPPGVVHLAGGPHRLLDVLDAQLDRRRARRVPSIDPDPGWVVPLPDDPLMERASESLGTLANGRAGTRGAVEEDGPATLPLFTVSGMYVADDESQLLPGPVWTRLEVPERTGTGTRELDLRGGLLLRTDAATGLRSLRFVSSARPHAMALRVESTSADPVRPAPITDPHGPEPPTEPTGHGEADGEQVATSASPGGGAICVAARDQISALDQVHAVERVAAWSTVDDGGQAEAAAATAQERLSALGDEGFDRLLAEHRAGWARRWADAEVVIEGAPGDELAARFAVFHLLSSAPDDGELALGARGLSGVAYGGHVFWDADVYVLPALAAIRPAAARAMVEYRLRRLPAAMAAARAEGRSGARFPWESAADGTDVTPRLVHLPGGRLVTVTTGEREEHIVADVAWAAVEYGRWSGDAALLAGPGRDLIVETARWWASRLRRDEAGRAHLDGVMGPDEYHERVDDNAFTNVMARWNLRQAADAVHGVDTRQAEAWRALADAVVDGYDAATGLYEQFAGYWDLEPLLMSDVAPPPVAADVLLGSARVAATQIIKQADVLMLHHLVPGEVVPGSLAANLAYYEPRTAHGSSLSPAIHAALLARAGQPERALELFRIAARLDLDDITGTTAGGLHLATMGGLWQALAYGFLGLRPGDAVLDVDPRLPDAWAALALRLRFHGEPIGVRADHHHVTVACEQPLWVRVGAADPHRCDPPGHTYDLEGSGR